MNKRLLLFLLLFICECKAQDTHYWTQQYGARSALLGGAVIHGLDDNSAVYYNPANLAFIQKATVSLNTSLYKYEDILVKDGAGDGIDLASQRISLYQNMISGLFTKNPTKPYRIGFNILTRTHTNFDFSKQFESSLELMPDWDGEEYYIGNIDLRTNINETWACIGGGYRINKYFSVGLTAIISYRNQRHTFAYSGRALSVLDTTSNNNIQVLTALNSFDFLTVSNIIGGLFKAGFHGRVGAWRFGLNISSPSFTIWGESKVRRESSQTNLPGNRDQIKTDEQRNLYTQYRYPLTIGAGIGFIYKTGMLSLAAEYFLPVAEYEMIQADSTDPTYPAYLSNGVEKFLTVYQGADAVLNIGLGWEQQLTEKIKLHLGVRTDFTYARSNDRITSGLTFVSSPLDIYHFSAGLSIRRRASKISFGVNYSYASRSIAQLINFSAPTIDPSKRLFLLGETSYGARITSHSITALIGYTYYFALK